MSILADIEFNRYCLNLKRLMLVFLSLATPYVPQVNRFPPRSLHQGSGRHRGWCFTSANPSTRKNIGPNLTKARSDIKPTRPTLLTPRRPNLGGSTSIPSHTPFTVQYLCLSPIMAANGGKNKHSPPLLGGHQTNSLDPTASDDDSTIKVAPKKPKDKATGVIKLKKPAPKHSDPGNWQEGRVIDGSWSLNPSGRS